MTGDVSTLTVINGIRHYLSNIRRLLPEGVTDPWLAIA
jgi:hypothetical protein